MSQKLYLVVVFLGLLIGLLSCEKADDDIILKPDAGASFENIENEGYHVQLSAQAAPDGQIGTWRVYVGENGTFDDVNDPKTIFRGEPGVSYQVGWELSAGGQYESDLITVSFKPLMPIVYHISGDTIWDNRSLILEAGAPKYGAKGIWEILEGNNARIELADSCIAHFIGANHSDYKVQWTLSYGAQQVSKEFTFVTDEFKANAGVDMLDIETNKNTDELKYVSLAALLPAGATGTWDLIGGNPGRVLNENKANSLFEGRADTTYTLTWDVNLEGERSLDTVRIRFRGKWAIWVDPFDKQEYRTTVINGLEWMADNYNRAIEPGVHSWYYGFAERSIVVDGKALENEEERKRHGRLYTWTGASNATPEGWRLPSPEDYNELETSLGGSIFAYEKIIEGGDAGLELLFSGYYQKYDFNDTAIRSTFIEQDNYGTYWTSFYNPSTGKSSGVLLTKDYEGIGSLSVGPEYYGFSVRYVRDVN